jgi:hypothetical protein
VGNGHGWKLPLQKPVSHVRILHQCLCRSEAISSQASRLACYHGVIPSQFPRLSSKQHDKRRNAVPFRPPPRRPRQVGPVRWAAYPRLRTTVRRAARACGIGEPRRLSPRELLVQRIKHPVDGANIVLGMADGAPHSTLPLCPPSSCTGLAFSRISRDPSPKARRSSSPTSTITSPRAPWRCGCPAGRPHVGAGSLMNSSTSGKAE